MGPDGAWRRIRWDNVARLAALVVLGLVVAVWPRLSGSGPRLPPVTAVPVGAPPAKQPRDSSGRVGRAKRRARVAAERAARERRVRVERRVAAERRVRAKQRASRERRARAAREQRVRAEKAARERRGLAERRVAAAPDAPAAQEAAGGRRPQPKRRAPRAPPADPAVAEFGLP
jgi:hypothetical protein